MKILKTYLIVILILEGISCSEKNIVGTVDLTNDLVAYYPFNGNAADESGFDNNGKVYGATLTMDRFGNQNSAFSFDGIIDDIRLYDRPLNNSEIQALYREGGWSK